MLFVGQVIEILGNEMFRHAAGKLLLFYLVSSLVMLTYRIPFVASNGAVPAAEVTGKTIVVPDNFTTIQAGINAAGPGDTVYVRSGIYYERIIVNQSVSLIGEDCQSTIIDGEEVGILLHVVHDDVNVSGFTIRRAGIWPGQIPESAVVLDLANRVNIVGNYLTSNLWYGIMIYASGSSLIANNTITNNGKGIVMYTGGNVVKGNNIINNSCGIYLDYSSSGNTILENTLINNSVIFDHYVQENAFYHNSFINSPVEAAPYATLLRQRWNDDYPSGGNFWNDPSSVDERSGSMQNQNGSDGFDDRRHVFNPYNIDYIPLMKPYSGPHDIVLKPAGVEKTVAGRGFNVSLSVKAINYGVTQETVNISLSVDSTVLQEQIVLLLRRNSSIISFSWNTDTLPYGNYTIKFLASAVPNETDTSDNTHEYTARVTVPGDVSGSVQGVPDGLVNMSDVTFIKANFGKRPPAWNPNADINSDGRVNMRDLGIACHNYGKHE